MAKHDEHGGLQIHPEYLTGLRAIGLDTFDALMRVPGDERLTKRGLAPWRERIVLRSGGRRLFLKRYRSPPLGQQLRRWMRRAESTAALEWRWLNRLPEIGIATPLPVAYGCSIKGSRELASLLVTAEVPGRSLETWVPDAVDGRLRDRRFRLHLLGEVADVVARLHGAGFYHRDLYLSHFFLEEGADGGVGLTLIDLQRMIAPRTRRRRWIVKDLAALDYSTPAGAISVRDRLRWYRRYRGVARLSRDDRALLRAVAAKRRRIARHSEKHGLG